MKSLAKIILALIALAIALPFIAIGSALVAMLVGLMAFLILATVVVSAVDHHCRRRFAA